MNPVETDLLNHLAAVDNATRRYDSLHDSVLDDLVSDVMTGNCERLTLADVLDEHDSKEFAALIVRVCNASGDDLILAREELDTWMTKQVREYCEESEELDRRVWERDEDERNGNV